jgi:hypothetical protein
MLRLRDPTFVAFDRGGPRELATWHGRVPERRVSRDSTSPCEIAHGLRVSPYPGRATPLCRAAKQHDVAWPELDPQGQGCNGTFQHPCGHGTYFTRHAWHESCQLLPSRLVFRRPRHKDSGGRHEHPFHQTQKVRRHGGRVGPQGPRCGCCRCAASAPRGWPLVDDPLVGPAGRRFGLDRASGGTRHHPGSLDVSAWARGLGPGIWPQRVCGQHVAFELSGFHLLSPFPHHPHHDLSPEQAHCRSHRAGQVTRRVCCS